MSNSRSQINSNFYQIANADPTCGNITGIDVGTVQATGNITAAYYFGNGSGLTGVTSSINYSNANVAAYLPTYTGNLASSSDIIALYANAVAQENEITALQAAQYSNANVAAYLPTYTGNLASSSDIIALYANAVAQENEITALQAAQYSNANVANYLQVLTSNVTTTANVSGAYIIGNGAFLTGLPAGYSNADVANYLPTYTGNLASSSDIIALYANAAAQSNAIANLQDLAYSNANVANYLQVLTTNVVTTANVQASYLIGNIRNTTGGYNDTNVAAYLPTYLGNLQSGNLLVVNSAVIQGNLTVLGNTTTINANTLNINDKDITVANGAVTQAEANGAGLIVGQGNLANIIFNNPANAWTLYPGVQTTGNVSGSYILGNITQATGYIVYGNANVAAYLPTYTGNLSASSDIIALYANAATQANAIINIDSNIANLYANAASQSNAIANLQASAYSNANVAAYLPTYTGNLASSSDIIALYANAATQSNAIVNLQSNVTTIQGNIANIDSNIANLYANAATQSNLIINLNSDIANLSANAGTQANAIANLQSNVSILQGNVVDINSNIANLYANAAVQSNAIANLEAAQYSNANVANYLPTYTGDIGAGNITVNETITANNILATEDVSSNTAFVATLLTIGGNLIGGDADFGGNVLVGTDVIATGNITAAYYIGNGYYLSGIQASNIVGAYGNANVAAYLPTYTGNLASSSDIIALYANAATQSNAIANLQAAQYSNANVSNFLANGFGSNTITTTGNIQAGTFKGTNFQATSSAGGTLKNSSGITQASWGAGGGDNFSVAVSTNLDGANAQIDISPTGTGHVHIKPTGTGAVEIAPVNTGSINNMVIGNVAPAAANVTTLGATGNVTAAYYFGNGSQLTGISSPYSNANVAAYLASNSNVVITTTGNITTSANVVTNTVIGPANANTTITTNGFVWNFSTTGNLILPSNATLQIQYANGTFVPLGYGNANVAAYLPTYTGALPSLTGNVTTTANVQGAYVLGNGAFLTGLPATYGNANVAAYLPTYTGNLAASSDIIALYANAATQSNAIANIVSNVTILQGDIITINSNIANLYANAATQSNAIANLQLAQYSNANVANYLPTYTGAVDSLTGNVTTTANVQAAYFIGNGSQLTGLPASYGNANVAAYLPTYTGNLASLAGNVTTTANVSGAYILGNGAFLSGMAGGGSSYSNANVANYLEVLTSNVTTTANVQANYFIGDGSQLTNVSIPFTPAVVDFTFSGETSNGAVTDEFVNYTFSSDYLNGNGNVSGTTWTRDTSAAGDRVAVSDAGVYVTQGELSNNGITWNSLGTTGISGSQFGIAYGNVSGTPTWVQVCSGGLIFYNRNANGIPTGTWSAATETATGLLYAVAYGNSVFMVAGDDNKIHRSGNGMVFTASTTSIAGQAGFRGVLWDGTRWLAVGNQGLWYSTDNGDNWTKVGALGFGSFPGGIGYNGTTNGIYRICGGSASTIYWCNGDPTVSGNWVTQSSVANLNILNGSINYLNGTWFATGGVGNTTQGIFRTSSSNANVWIGDSTPSKTSGSGIGGWAVGPNLVVTTSGSEVFRIPLSLLANYAIGLPADPTYGANTLYFAPSSGANANVAAVELGNLIVANRPTYTASYANSRVTVIDTNSGGDITGAFTILVNTLSPNGTITLSANDGANAAQDVIEFTDPVTSATYQYSPAFNSNISNIVTDIGTAETLPDWLGSVFSTNTVRFTSDIPGFLPFNQLISATITNGLSNGVTTTLAVARTVDSYGYSGATVPGGNDTELQFNDNGSFAGTNGIYFNAATSLLSLPAVIERVFTTNTPMTGNIDYDVQNQGILYYNVNATANANINFRGYSALTLDNTLAVDDSITVKLWNQNGATAYLPVNYRIDGSNITPVWLNGTAPTAANANSTMQYQYTIVKTAANTYTVLASQQRFA